MMNYFAQNLKTILKHKNLTQTELAKASNVSNGMIFFWENEKYKPSATNIIAIAKFFNISIDD